jgi:protein-S-isoprenylcysteine O-methyltransferase Ste14
MIHFLVAVWVCSKTTENVSQRSRLARKVKDERNATEPSQALIRSLTLIGHFTHTPIQPQRHATPSRQGVMQSWFGFGGILSIFIISVALLTIQTQSMSFD